MIWIRWRWQYGFTFQPYTKYHAIDPDSRNRTLCGRGALHAAFPPWGNTTDDPRESQCCKQCLRAIATAKGEKAA